MEEYFKAVKVTENVYWVGAIDWSIRNFHGYETGRGSTYNAFLVLDEKITLIDSVKGPFVGELLARIRSVIGDVTKIDYIVSNHAEPDHSGGLPATIEAIKPEKVFASPVGQKTLTAYYGDLGITPVKTGEAISIGKGNIAFVETKMLHWPDSMVTYLDSEKILFSQDAFGMHLAGSRRFADEYAPFILEYEGRKYFANILNHLAPKVIELLDALPGLNLDIQMIAPDHGPIWRRPEDIRWILDLYRDCAMQLPKPRAVVAFSTMWHSTERRHPLRRRRGQGYGPACERPQRGHDRGCELRAHGVRRADHEQSGVPGHGGHPLLCEGTAPEEQDRLRLRFLRLERGGRQADRRRADRDGRRAAVRAVSGQIHADCRGYEADVRKR